MDSNGVRFQLLNCAEDFRADAREPCQWDPQCQLFRLNAQQTPRFSDVGFAKAMQAWMNNKAVIEDDFGQLGVLSDDRKNILYSAHWPIRDTSQVLASALLSNQSSNEVSSDNSLTQLSLAPVQAPNNSVFAHLHLGGDGRIAAPFSDGVAEHGLLVVHLARKWQSQCILTQAAQFSWVDQQNRVWLITEPFLTLCQGEPLAQSYTANPAAFEPQQINLNPLQAHWQQALPVNYKVLGLCGDQTQLYILVYELNNLRQSLLIRTLSDDSTQPMQIFTLPKMPFVIGLSVMADKKLALMLVLEESSIDKDLPVIQVPDLNQEQDGNQKEIVLEAKRYPQHSQGSASFISYVFSAGKDKGAHRYSAKYIAQHEIKTLYPLQQSQFLTKGSTTLNRALDSQQLDTLWHRMYIEAMIPVGCTLKIALKVYNDELSPNKEWVTQPALHHQNIASEIPFYQGRFSETHAIDNNSIGPSLSADNLNGIYTPKKTQGLYEILIQHNTGEIRELRGRYLEIKITMTGGGRHTPAISAIRVHHQRFSWQQAYLPSHFHQQYSAVDNQEREGQAADSQTAANGADIRERMLASFEGMMTPIEERIVYSEALLNPLSAPQNMLPVLAKMLACSLPDYWPVYRARNWLSAQPELQKMRGTHAGLCLALDVVTDGAVAKGHVIAVENFRLRRTLATILGIDMNDDEHPLTLGVSQSGNSIVGESLILSADQGAQFLALFAPQLASKQQSEQVAALYEHYAYQVSVVVHASARNAIGQIEQTLAQWLPAHITYQLLETDHPFVLGLSPLLGIDTYLEQQPHYRQVILDATQLGREGILHNPIALASFAG
ncbi:MAG: phage tail protein [Oceanospirillaceae bacterium]